MFYSEFIGAPDSVHADAAFTSQSVDERNFFFIVLITSKIILLHKIIKKIFFFLYKT